MRRFLLAVLAVSALLVSSGRAWAANEGQADLDMATELQIGAESLADLEKVVSLAESAIKKGLDKGQEEFAKQMVAATLYQHAARLTASIFDQSPPTPRWRFVRQQAMKDLEKAQKFDATLPDVPLLIARLQALPEGDERVGKVAIDEAIKLLKAKDDPKTLAKALVIRAATGKDEDQQLADFEAAVKADAENTEALQGLSVLLLSKDKNQEAIAILEKLAAKSNENPAVLGVLAEALTNLKKYDEALVKANKVIEIAPKVTLGYNLRARIHVLKDDLKAAVEDLDEALKIDPKDLASLLLRSRLLAAQGKDDQAKADVEKALALNPDIPQAILLRSMLAAQKGNIAEAVADLQVLIHSDPKNAEYRLQLAAVYVADKRPRKAIEILDAIIDDDPKNSDALRSRGDALLSITKHADAIADYDNALKIDPEDTGVLNNLAWVLATSPEDKLRNAKRSIELGTKACELTKYEKPHILSTLDSGYAEAGDWENAIKWSSKAVELGEGDIKEQLQKELDSYKAKKPWRESQNVEENTKPLEPKKNDLDT